MARAEAKYQGAARGRKRWPGLKQSIRAQHVAEKDGRAEAKYQGAARGRKRWPG
ncbi:hypothetical protein [Bacillus safensis]|uniref:hypothetical protein n=1 Tax=Bacillus safensis TaxID=561879 RepID=UPI0015F2EA9E|nr:hypothetical protein [Bacillus safensis]